MQKTSKELLGQIKLDLIQRNEQSFVWPNGRAFERDELIRGNYISSIPNGDGWYITEQGELPGLQAAARLAKQNVESAEFTLWDAANTIFRRNPPPRPDDEGWYTQLIEWAKDKDVSDLEELDTKYHILNDLLIRVQTLLEVAEFDNCFQLDPFEDGELLSDEYGDYEIGIAWGVCGEYYGVIITYNGYETERETYTADEILEALGNIVDKVVYIAEENGINGYNCSPAPRDVLNEWAAEIKEQMIVEKIEDADELEEKIEEAKTVYGAANSVN